MVLGQTVGYCDDEHNRRWLGCGCISKEYAQARAMRSTAGSSSAIVYLAGWINVGG
jgi:hypothetical protein